MRTTKKPLVNIIEIGNMKLMTENGNMRDLLKVATRILTKHKDIVKDKNKPEIIPLEMFG
ncbi:MAG: hypothetical protein ABIF10_03915 [Candidatus Woesearchaeota archaeon]